MNQDNPIFTPANNPSDATSPIVQPTDNPIVVTDEADKNKAEPDKILEPVKIPEKETQTLQSEPPIEVQDTNDLSLAPKVSNEMDSSQPAQPTVQQSQPVKTESATSTPVSFTSKPIDTSPINNSKEALAAEMFPTPKQNNTAKAVTSTTIVALAFIALGFTGGFFGFQYSPKISKLFTASADSTASITNVTLPQSTSVTTGSIGVWPIYNNTTYLYSLKFPDNWYGQNINDPTATDITLSNANPQDSNAQGTKVEIVAQNANSQDLKTWIDAKNTTTANSPALSSLTVAGQSAYQQTGTSSITTYLKQGNYILVITYSADTANFTSNKTIYNQILESLKL